LEWTQIQVQGEFGPVSRHTSVVYRDKLYSYGGSDGQDSLDLYALDLRIWRWEKVLARGEVPESRDEHTMVLDGDSMVIFGGYLDLQRTNHLFRYHFKENRWERVIPVGGVEPAPRSGHSAVVWGDQMVIFGGKDQDANKLEDVWSLDLNSATWRKLEGGDAPKGRSGHSANLFGDCMVVFGGIFEITQELNDMHFYDLKRQRWITFFEEAASPSKKNRVLDTNPDKSPLRRGTTSFSKNPVSLFKRGTLKAPESPFSRNKDASPGLNRTIDPNANASFSTTQNYRVNTTMQTKSPSKYRSSKSKARRLKENLEKFHQRDQRKENEGEVLKLNSPTSNSMKNSFIFKNSGPKFD